jgi:hypothetical protein
MIKEFWCCPEVPVDFEAMKQKRDSWFGINRLWYEPERRVPRNTHNPGNYGEKYMKQNHMEETALWKSISGPRPITTVESSPVVRFDPHSIAATTPGIGDSATLAILKRHQVVAAQKKAKDEADAKVAKKKIQDDLDAKTKKKLASMAAKKALLLKQQKVLKRSSSPSAVFPGISNDYIILLV